MTKARPKEGPRAPLFYGALWLSLSALGNAQTVEVSALERCAALESQAEKLACFEAIVASSGPDADANAASAAAPMEAQVADPRSSEPEAAGEIAAGSEMTPATDTTSMAPPAPETVTGQVTAATAITSAAAPAPATEVTEAAAAATSTEVDQPINPDDEFGRDHLRSDAEEAQEERLRARVVDVGATRHGALIFYLDNGQVWQQMEPRYYPYPRGRDFDVEISTGMMGEYQLQVEGAGRKVTIRRTK